MHFVDKSSVITAGNRNKIYLLKTHCYGWIVCLLLLMEINGFRHMG